MLSIKTRISVRMNALTKERVASAAIVDLRTVSAQKIKRGCLTMKHPLLLFSFTSLLEIVSYADTQDRLVEIFYQVIPKLKTNRQLVGGINLTA